MIISRKWYCKSEIGRKTLVIKKFLMPEIFIDTNSIEGVEVCGKRSIKVTYGLGSTVKITGINKKRTEIVKDKIMGIACLRMV